MNYLEEIMSIAQEIKRKIDESDMEFTEEQKFALIRIIDNGLKDYKPVEHLKKDTINVVDVFTGMMPRPKADAHIQKIASSETMKKFVDDGYDIVYIGMPEHGSGTKVHYLEKGKLNFVEISTGMMPKPKAEKYLYEMNDRFKRIKGFDDYDVTFHGYYQDNSARFKEE